MNFQSLLSQFTSNPGPSPGKDTSHATVSPLAAITSSIPGGLAGGAAAGGVMALLMSNKSARKVMGNVATIGGSALVGGIAYKAFDNWKQNRPLSHTQSVKSDDIQQAKKALKSPKSDQTSLYLTQIKAMIAAGKADGHLDAKEQTKIFQALEEMGLSSEEKAAVFDAMTRDISVEELAATVTDDHHKAEVYLAAYLAIEVDEEKERAYLNSLGAALALPEGLPIYLEQQAQQGVA